MKVVTQGSGHNLHLLDPRPLNTWRVINAREKTEDGKTRTGIHPSSSLHSHFFPLVWYVTRFPEISLSSSNGNRVIIQWTSLARSLLSCVWRAKHSLDCPSITCPLVHFLGLWKVKRLKKDAGSQSRFLVSRIQLLCPSLSLVSHRSFLYLAVRKKINHETTIIFLPFLFLEELSREGHWLKPWTQDRFLLLFSPGLNSPVYWRTATIRQLFSLIIFYLLVAVRY